MDIIRNKIGKIRKKQSCVGCLKIFPPGTEMEIQTNREDGQIYTVYLCDWCQFIASKAIEDFPDGFSEGNLGEWANENGFDREVNDDAE